MATSVTPPPGFVLDQQPQAGGAVTPPAGFVLDGQQQQTQQEDAPPQSTDPRAAIGSGFVKAAGQTVNTISKGLHMLPGVGETLAPQQGIDAASSMEKTHGLGEGIGATAENILEYISADGAFKAATQALPLAGKLKELHGIAEFIEAHPYMAKLFGAGAKNAALAGGQSAMHGGTAGEAGASAAIGAGAGVAGEAVSQGVGAITKAATPEMTTVAGESLPKTTKLAGAEVPELAKAQKAGATKAYSNIATDVANKNLARFGEKSAGVTSMGEAAEELKGAAKPTFEKLDEISNGEYATLRKQMDNANKVMKKASSMKDLQEAQQAYDDAGNKVDELFKKAEGQISPKDLENARGAWRDMKVLEKSENYLDAAYSRPDTEVAMTGKDRTIDPKALRGRFTALLKRMPAEDVQRVFGKDGVKNISDLADLETSATKSVASNQMLEEVAKQGYLGKAAKTIDEAKAMAAKQLYLNPKLGKLFTSSVRLGASPQIAVPVMLRTLGLTESQNNGN